MTRKEATASKQEQRAPRHAKPKRQRVRLNEEHGQGHVDRIPPRVLARQQDEADAASLARQCSKRGQAR